MNTALSTALFTSLCAVTLFAGCDRNRPEGPAERAGRHIDNTADEIHDDAVRTGRNAKSMAHDVHERLKTDDTAEDARERNRY